MKTLTTFLLAVLLGAPTLANEIPASGAELLAPYKQQLQSALKAGIQQGPLAALSVCQLQAPAIAESLSTDGVTVGRASQRLRNPANAAPDWVQPVLNAYLADASDREPRAVEISDSVAGYVEPILLQPMCVMCHGDAIAPAVATRIRELYPADEATGFRPGELRGVFWVQYPSAL